MGFTHKHLCKIRSGSGCQGNVLYYFTFRALLSLFNGNFTESCVISLKIGNVNFHISHTTSVIELVLSLSKVNGKSVFVVNYRSDVNTFEYDAFLTFMDIGAKKIETFILRLK